MQNGYIFTSTIEENITLNNIDNNDVKCKTKMKEAAKLALLDEYIMTLPQKYNTMISEFFNFLYPKVLNI